MPVVQSRSNPVILAISPLNTSGARYIQSEIEVLFVTRYSSQPRRRLGLLTIMAKCRESSARLSTFSVESLREEVDEEISTEKIGTRLLRFSHTRGRDAGACPSDMLQRQNHAFSHVGNT